MTRTAPATECRVYVLLPLISARGPFCGTIDGLGDRASDIALPDTETVIVNRSRLIIIIIWDVGEAHIRRCRLLDLTRRGGSAESRTRSRS